MSKTKATTDKAMRVEFTQNKTNQLPTFIIVTAKFVMIFKMCYYLIPVIPNIVIHVLMCIKM